MTERGQTTDLQQCGAFGIHPEADPVLGLKSRHHFRAAFAPSAGEIIVCDSGAIALPNGRVRDYRKLLRQIRPLDEIAAPDFIRT